MKGKQFRLYDLSNHNIIQYDLHNLQKVIHRTFFSLKLSLH